MFSCRHEQFPPLDMTAGTLPDKGLPQSRPTSASGVAWASSPPLPLSLELTAHRKNRQALSRPLSATNLSLACLGRIPNQLQHASIVDKQERRRSSNLDLTPKGKKQSPLLPPIAFNPAVLASAELGSPGGSTPSEQSATEQSTPPGVCSESTGGKIVRRRLSSLRRVQTEEPRELRPSTDLSDDEPRFGQHAQTAMGLGEKGVARASFRSTSDSGEARKSTLYRSTRNSSRATSSTRSTNGRSSFEDHHSEPKMRQGSLTRPGSFSGKSSSQSMGAAHTQSIAEAEHALMDAVAEQNEQAVERLLRQHGQRLLHGEGMMGVTKTALMYAARTGNKRLCEILCNVGGPQLLQYTDINHRNAADYAELNGFPELAQALKDLSGVCKTSGRSAQQLSVMRGPGKLLLPRRRTIE